MKAQQTRSGLLIGAEGNRATCQQPPCRQRKAGENQCWSESARRLPFSRKPIQRCKQLDMNPGKVVEKTVYNVTLL
jgi:hypothetical protein